MHPIAEQLRPLVSTDVEAETLAGYVATQYQRAEDDLDPDITPDPDLPTQVPTTHAATAGIIGCLLLEEYRNRAGTEPFDAYMGDVDTCLSDVYAAWVVLAALNGEAVTR